MILTIAAIIAVPMFILGAAIVAHEIMKHKEE